MRSEGKKSTFLIDYLVLYTIFLDEKKGDFFEIVRQVLIPMFYKETQLGRSFQKSNLEFKKRLFEATLELADKVDQGILKTETSNRKSWKPASKPMFL